MTIQKAVHINVVFHFSCLLLVSVLLQYSPERALVKVTNDVLVLISVQRSILLTIIFYYSD